MGRDELKTGRGKTKGGTCVQEILQVKGSATVIATNTGTAVPRHSVAGPKLSRLGCSSPGKRLLLCNAQRGRTGE